MELCALHRTVRCMHDNSSRHQIEARFSGRQQRVHDAVRVLSMNGAQVRESHMMDAQVQWLTMSTASSPMPMERPAVLNCSLL